MLGQRVGQRLGSLTFPTALAAAIGLGLLLGLATIRLSPLYVLGATTGSLFLALILTRRPEIALLALIALSATIIDAEAPPTISFGAGSLGIGDVILLPALGLILVRGLVDPNFKNIRTPLDLPFLGFYGMVLVSTLFAVSRSTVGFHPAFRELRTVTQYLTFFVLTRLVREERQVRLLLKGLLFLAAVVGGAMIAQFVLGPSAPILPGRVETLYTQGTSYSEITRMLPPGASLEFVVFVMGTVVLMVSDNRRPAAWMTLLWGLTGIGVLLTFNRSFWVGGAIALVLLFCLVKEGERKRLAAGALVAVALIVGALAFVEVSPESRAAKLLSAATDRLNTVSSIGNVLADTSFQWRYSEYDYALPQLPSRLILGVGMGGSYRPWDSRMDWQWEGHGFDGRGYIHNGHLWLILKGGGLAYAFWVWLSVSFVTRGLKYWRLVPDAQMRGAVLGFTLAYVGILFAAVVDPVFSQWYWTPLFGIMMGLNEVIVGQIASKHTDERGWQLG